MATKKAYVFRGQGIGIQLDRIFLKRPSAKDFDEVMAHELAHHGHDPKTGEPRERWVRIQEVEVIDGEAGEAGDAPDKMVAKPSKTKKKGEEQPAGQGIAGASEIEMTGMGHVENPPAAESMSIGPEDVGTLKI